MLELPDYCYFFAHKRKHRLAGDSNTTEALGTFCRSSQQNFPLVSGRTRYPSQLTIVFKSDLDVQYTGFQAKIFTCKSRLSLGWNPLKLLFSVLVYAKPIKRHDIFLQQPQLISATQIWILAWTTRPVYQDTTMRQICSSHASVWKVTLGMLVKVSCEYDWQAWLSLKNLVRNSIYMADTNFGTDCTRFQAVKIFAKIELQDTNETNTEIR